MIHQSCRHTCTVMVILFVESIIQILLDNHARTDIKNRKKQAPCHVAQNAQIFRIFQTYESAPRLVTERHKSQVRHMLINTNDRMKYHVKHVDIIACSNVKTYTVFERFSMYFK
jgi:hypothetical protein